MAFSYHASHEQFKPSELLKYAQAANIAGFSGISCSDHFTRGAIAKIKVVLLGRG
jgi:hypothetical protein